MNVIKIKTPTPRSYRKLVPISTFIETVTSTAIKMELVGATNSINYFIYCLSSRFNNSSPVDVAKIDVGKALTFGVACSFEESIENIGLSFDGYKAMEREKFLYQMKNIATTEMSNKLNIPEIRKHWQESNTNILESYIYDLALVMSLYANIIYIANENVCQKYKAKTFRSLKNKIVEVKQLQNSFCSIGFSNEFKTFRRDIFKKIIEDLETLNNQ